MPINAKITVKGIDKALKVLNTYTKDIDKVVTGSLERSAIKVKDQLNLKVEEYQNKAQVFMVSPKKVFIGPSIELAKDIVEMPEWTKYKARKECPWWYYATYVLPSEKLPILGAARDKVRQVAMEMIWHIRTDMIKSIQEMFRGI